MTVCSNSCACYACHMLPSPDLSQYLHHVGPRLLASGCELLLDEVSPLLKTNHSVLEFNAGAGMLSQKLIERTLQSKTTLWVCDKDPTLLRYIQSKKKHPKRVAAAARNLPFPNAMFNATVGNAYFLDVEYTKALLQSLHRVLLPGGSFLVTGFLKGSFDELFDLAAEAAEMEGDDERQQRILSQQQSLVTAETFTRLAEEYGFDDIKIGICERALFLADGEALLHDPLVTELLAPLWLGPPTKGAPQPRERKRVLMAVKEAIDAYFSGQNFSLRLCTLVAQAKRTQ